MGRSQRNILLLSLVLILGIVIGVGHPVLNRARERARKTACKSNLCCIGKACLLYADQAEEPGQYPNRLEDLFGEIITDKRLLRCPSASHNSRSSNAETGNQKSDYFYFPGSTETSMDGLIAFCRCENHKGGVNVLIGAGAVEWVPKEEFRKRILSICEDRGILIEPPKNKHQNNQPESFSQALNGLAKEERIRWKMELRKQLTLLALDDEEAIKK